MFIYLNHRSLVHLMYMTFQAMLFSLFSVTWEIILGTYSLLWSRSQIQFISNWLLPHHLCHYCTNGHMLAIRFIGSYLGKDTDALLHSGACMIPPGTMRAGQWEGSFKFNASLLSIYPVTKVCNVSSTKFLSFCSSEQPRGMETFCVVFRVSGAFWSPSPKETFYTWNKIFGFWAFACLTWTFRTSII